MSSVEGKAKPALGFITVIRHQQHGLFGGYLLLNHSGRPLEFHCTTPIKPNRAQEILYGPTLEDYLYGEQIGQTLLKQAKAKPWLVCTDQKPVLAVQDFVPLPVALILPPEETSLTLENDRKIIRFDQPHHGGPNLVTFDLGRNRVALPARAESERAAVVERFQELAESFDLAEPFSRIREAIEEAQQAVR